MKLNSTEKNTLFWLLVSTFFSSLIVTLSTIQDIIAKKALHSLDWQLTLLAMIWPLSNFFSIWWGKILERSRIKTKYFLIVAFLGRLVLVFGLWVSNMSEFILLLTVVYFFSSLLIPALNSLYQTNFRKEIRGKLFGYTVSLGTLLSMITTYFAGHLLDVNEQFYRQFLLFAGISGCLSCLVLPLIKNTKIDEASVVHAPLSFKEVFLSPITRSMQLMKSNKEFAIFERNFSLYGMGFIMVIPVIPIYLVEHLHLNYTNTFIAKGVISQVGILLLSPFFGKLLDRKDVFHFTSLVFALLMFYPLGFIASIAFHSFALKVAFVYLAYLLFGVAMSGVNIAWSMGSISFAGKEDASMFQSVHVTLTGVRGLIAPFLGFIILRTFGLTSVFVVAFLFLATASFLSYKQYKCKKNNLDSCRGWNWFWN